MSAGSLESLFTAEIPLFLMWLGKTSFMASVVVVLILGMKWLLKDRLPVQWQYAMWLILIVRLILPWAPESSFSVYNLFSSTTSAESETNYVGEEISESSHDQVLKHIERDSSKYSSKYSSESNNVITKSPAKNNINPERNDMQGEKQGLLVSDAIHWLYLGIFSIWLIGFILLLFYLWKINRKFRRILFFHQRSQRDSSTLVHILQQCKDIMGIKRTVELKITDLAQGPMLLGFVRPQILLPSYMEGDFSEEELKYVFLHELVHFKRKDIVLNWAMLLLLFFHWFNPVLWYGYRKMREDQELSCDQKAISYLSDREVKAYGYTIIKLLENRSNLSSAHLVVAANFSSNKRQLKRRMVMISKFRRNSARWSIIGFVVITAFMMVALTNAKADSKAAGIEKEIVGMKQQNAVLLDTIDPSIRASVEDSMDKIMRHLGLPLPLIEVTTVTETNQIFLKFQGDDTDMTNIWVSADTGELEQAILGYDIPLDRVDLSMIEKAKKSLQEKGYEGSLEIKDPIHRHVEFNNQGLEHFVGTTEALGVQTELKFENSGEVVFINDEVSHIYFELPVENVSEVLEEKARQVLYLLNNEADKANLTNANIVSDPINKYEYIQVNFDGIGYVSIDPDTGTVMQVFNFSVPVKGLEEYSKPRISYGDAQFRREFSPLVEQLLAVDVTDYSLVRNAKSPGSFTFSKSGESDVGVAINPYGEIVSVSRFKR